MSFSPTSPRYPLHCISSERPFLSIMERKYLPAPLLQSRLTGRVLGQRSDWRMHLNNYLQGRYGHTRDLSWSYSQSGPSHDTRWLAVAYCKPFDSVFYFLRTDGWLSIVNGIEYGRGVARDRGTAMEIAAETTFRALTTYSN